MGFLDRLTGVNEKNTYTEANVYFHNDMTVRVDWLDKQVSPLARQIAPAYFEENRVSLFDRMYLASVFYGTMLRLLKSAPDDQEYAFIWLSWTADELLANGNYAASLKNDQLVMHSRSTVTDHYRTLLFQGRGGNLMNRDYTVKSTEISGLFAGMFMFTSLATVMSKTEANFLGNWLTGMKTYYLQNSPNDMSSELPATIFGMHCAVEEETNSFARKLGIDPPSF